jgi:hypothetical protein
MIERRNAGLKMSLHVITLYRRVVVAGLAEPFSNRRQRTTMGDGTSLRPTKSWNGLASTCDSNRRAARTHARSLPHPQ